MRTLSQEELLQVETYLKEKYGLTEPEPEETFPLVTDTVRRFRLRAIRSFVKRCKQRVADEMRDRSDLHKIIFLGDVIEQELAALEKQVEWADTKEERVETVEKLVEEAVRIIGEHK